MTGTGETKFRRSTMSPMRASAAVDTAFFTMSTGGAANSHGAHQCQLIRVMLIAITIVHVFNVTKLVFS